MLPDCVGIQWATLWLFAARQNSLGWQLLKVWLNKQNWQKSKVKETQTKGSIFLAKIQDVWISASMQSLCESPRELNNSIIAWLSFLFMGVWTNVPLINDFNNSVCTACLQKVSRQYQTEGHCAKTRLWERKRSHRKNKQNGKNNGWAFIVNLTSSEHSFYKCSSLILPVGSRVLHFHPHLSCSVSFPKSSYKSTTLTVFLSASPNNKGVCVCLHVCVRWVCPSGTHSLASVSIQPT